ncbi:MAG: shikimate kinase [Lachnospiraceae bacterium]|nr:shikimate kinase [Lachnospiraceae bacterium]
MKKNIVLIGMPGAGKSTIGVLLAKALNYNFIDADLVIQQQNNKKLFEIINEVGIEEFLKIEDETISNINTSGTVIATGGSAVYGENAMNHMKDNGIVMYLKLSCLEIINRISNIKTRGIAMKEGKTIFDIYNERVPLYEKYADIIIDAEGTNIEECVSLVMEEIVNILNNR